MKTVICRIYARAGPRKPRGDFCLQTLELASFFKVLMNKQPFSLWFPLSCSLTQARSYGLVILAVSFTK